jgi:hypothetical protein
MASLPPQINTGSSFDAHTLALLTIRLAQPYLNTRETTMDPMALGQMKDVFMMLTMWAFFGTVLYIIATALRRRQRNQMQQHVLDKFASAKDFAEFVQSPAGQKYVESFADTTTSSQGAILNSVRAGVVLLFMGVGLALANLNFLPMRIGTLFAAVGLGFLISAAISLWLVKKFEKEAKE